MQVYIQAVFNHFRALQSWAKAKGGAKLTLDIETFIVEVKYAGRYYRFLPMFQGRIAGSIVHTTVLPQDLIGFGGWRPYEALQHPHSTDKLLFKGFLAQADLRAPAHRLGDSSEPPEFDYLIKGRKGSFGKQIEGPFRGGQLPGVSGRSSAEGTVFYEQFIPGKMLKVWFWGSRAFFAHAHAFPTVEGDGVSSVEVLVKRRLAQVGEDWDRSAHRDILLASLHFQDMKLEVVPAAGEVFWIDFRYSYYHARSGGPTARSDSDLPALMAQTGEQIPAMGQALARLLQPTFAAPVMISVDGMLDEQGRIWWLEMNTNSVVPPEGYAVMFEDLFG